MKKQKKLNTISSIPFILFFSTNLFSMYNLNLGFFGPMKLKTG